LAALVDLFGFLAVVCRGLTLALSAVLVGSVVFSLVCLRPSQFVREEGAGDVLGLVRRFGVVSAGGLLCVEAFWLTANSALLADTAGLGFDQIAGANFFLSGGATAIAALVIGSGLWVQRFARWWMLAPAAAMIAAETMTSHAVARLDRVSLLIAATSIHQAATAVWIGGLPVWLLTIRRLRSFPAVQTVSRRFSMSAQISVALLLGAGLVLSWFYIGSLPALYGTTYGLMMLAKLILFGLVICLAALNFRIVHNTDPDARPVSLVRLRRFGESEIGIGFTIVLAAASLTSQPPAVDLPRDRVTAAEIATRLLPQVPRLQTPPVSALSPAVQRQWKDENRARTEAEAFVPGASYSPSTPGDIAWSEYNHNWAGVVLLAVGALAVLSGLGIARWARHWPLAFIGLAIFLLIRADPENWPLGPNGFWESFAVADVAQHRFFVVLIVAFAVFEWGIQTGHLQSQAAALVFPSVCFLGGAALLTHSHALSNIREATLIELSHISLAILAVLAGWARWLELRLLPSDTQILSRVWPACFVLMGFVLLFYREA
jgi:putative copper resistance protein D